MSTTKHSQAHGIHPGAFVGPTPPDTTGLQDHVLWIQTPATVQGDDMPRTILSVSADTTLTTANMLVVCRAANLKITLPDAAANTGQAVTVVADNLGCSVLNPDGTPAQYSTQIPWSGMSDGTQWWSVDY